MNSSVNLFFYKFMIILFTSIFIFSCSEANPIQDTVIVEKTNTPAIVFTSTIEPSPTFVFTPFPTTFAQATIASFNPLCVGAKNIYKPEISPNGEWIAAQCTGENDTEDSPLQVSRLDGSKTWKIYYSQHKKDGIVDRKYGILPYRWSQDGKYLYAFTGQIGSGCCWIGLRYVLLVRLNLETGEQVPLLGADSDYYIFDFIISDSDRYLIFTPPSKQPYDFTVLDMKTWETKQFFIKFPYAIDIYYAVMSPNEDKIILPLFENLEFNQYYVDAIAMIDLTTGEQKLIISDLKDGEELYPMKWNDETQVVVANAYPDTSYYQEEIKFWLLNIITGELTETENP